MKNWWKNVTKDYFTFSKKERNGLLTLIILSSIIFLFSRYWPVSDTKPKSQEFQQELASLKITVDSNKRNKEFSHYNRYNDDESNDYDRSNKYENWNNKKGELFVFDPNTLDANGWQRLGIRDKTINIIQNYIAKGYRFKKPEDLSKIYGLRPEDANRLIPYIQIAESSTANNPTGSYTNNIPTTNSPKLEGYKTTIIEINTADTTAFIALPGIGSKLANRIIIYRNKLGGFVNINQIGETFGLQDSIFQKIKPRLQCNGQVIRQININSGDAEQLKNHPYIRWNIANAIVSYRGQHGNFKSIEDLKKIDLIGEDIIQKLQPYIVF